MPGAVDEGSFALSAFYLEAAFLVGSNGTFVDGKNAHGNSVKVQAGESEAENGSGCFGANSLAEVACLHKTNGE